MRITSGDVEVVWTPLGIIDGAMTLRFNTVVMLEQHAAAAHIPDDQVTIVSSGHENVGEAGVRLQPCREVAWLSSASKSLNGELSEWVSLILDTACGCE